MKRRPLFQLGSPLLEGRIQGRPFPPIPYQALGSEPLAPHPLLRVMAGPLEWLLLVGRAQEGRPARSAPGRADPRPTVRSLGLPETLFPRHRPGWAECPSREEAGSRPTKRNLGFAATRVLRLRLR